MIVLEDRLSKQFAANLRRLRAADGLSQEELAFRAGIHRTQVSLLESGKRFPRFITLVKLKGALGASANDLFAGIEFEPYVMQAGGFVIDGSDGEAAS
jgi:transcriptional regulator with XRE-family HTH domain